MNIYGIEVSQSRAQQIKATHRKIRTVFQRLERDFGISYSTSECCINCATNHGPDDYVFLTPQEIPLWHGHADGEFWIGFGNATNGTPEALGEILVIALKAFGLQVEWNGNADTRVLVTV